MFWRISRILNLDICCLIGCHLLLIVGGGGHQFNRAISDQYEGSCPPAVPGLVLAPLGSWQRVINVTAAE